MFHNGYLMMNLKLGWESTVKLPWIQPLIERCSIYPAAVSAFFCFPILEPPARRALDPLLLLKS